MTETREYDIVLYGATGFVGKLTAEYLARAGGNARIALAGRSTERLLAIRETLGESAQSWPVLVADASVTVDAGRDGRPDAGRRHHRRALQPIRPTAGGRVRGGGHRLRRPDRRAAVRSRQHRPVPQAGARHRCAHRARVRIRLDPFGSHRVRAVSEGARRRRGRPRQHRLRGSSRVRWILRRHHRVGGGSDAHRLQRSRRPSSVRGPLHAEPGPRRRTRARCSARSAVAPWSADRPGAHRSVDGRIRDGAYQHTNCAAQQRITRVGVRQAVPVQRAHESWVVGRGTGGVSRRQRGRQHDDRDWAAATSGCCHADW